MTDKTPKSQEPKNNKVELLVPKEIQVMVEQGSDFSVDEWRVITVNYTDVIKNIIRNIHAKGEAWRREEIATQGFRENILSGYNDEGNEGTKYLIAAFLLSEDALTRMVESFR